jgi:hypothetical protein
LALKKTATDESMDPYHKIARQSNLEQDETGEKRAYRKHKESLIKPQLIDYKEMAVFLLPTK